MKSDKLKRALLIVVAALTLLRLVLAGVTELLPEEAYYWTYAQHPALGYFDHPPMVAWIIWLGTALLGDTETGVRVVNILLAVASCGLMVATGWRWFGERVAVWAALLCCLLPAFIGAGFIVTPDGVLVFFWMLTLWAVTAAVQTRRTSFWLLAGAGLGGAMLSKYYAMLLVPSIGLFLLSSREYRYWLRRPQPWLAGLVALAMFSPVIVWNAQHEWASFAFQSTRTAEPDPHVLRNIGIFWLYQLGVTGAVALLLFAVAAVRGVKRAWRQGDDRWNFAMSFSLPLFGLFLAASFKTQVHVNWTMPAFLSLALAGAAVFLEGLDSPKPRRWRVGAWTMAGIGVVTIVLLHLILASGKPEKFAYSHVGGWRQLAKHSDAAGRELAARTGQQPFFLGADKYNIAAELGFYLRHPEDCVNLYALGAQGLGYRYWTDLSRYEGRPAIVASLSVREKLRDDLRRYFQQVDPPEPVAVNGPGTGWENAQLIRCYGYRRKP